MYRAARSGGSQSVKKAANRQNASFDGWRYVFCRCRKYSFCSGCRKHVFRQPAPLHRLVKGGVANNGISGDTGSADLSVIVSGKLFYQSLVPLGGKAEKPIVVFFVGEDRVPAIMCQLRV